MRTSDNIHPSEYSDVPAARELADDRRRVMACWLGKAVGGTLGTPYEGMDGPFELTFYDPVPEKMLPNDDLDLQVVWACALDKLADVRVDRHILAQAWLDHVKFPFSEYAVALRNLRLGIKPPLSGSYDNWYANGMGAAIRSELWACLAPRNPKLAVAYAYEDACVDHADEGVWAEVFLAALQSEAFGVSDPDELLDTALSYLPGESRIARAIQDTRKWWAACADWQVVREHILERYGHELPAHCVMNLAFTVLGWLAADGDFTKGICTAANCGKDTDCTAATVGALMGIIDPSCIPDTWLKPIGDSLVLSPEIVNVAAPSTLMEFTDLIMDIRSRLNERAPSVQSVPQSLEPFQINVQAGFTDWPSVERAVANSTALCLPEGTREMTLPGAVASLDRESFENDALVLRYTFRLNAPREVRLIFNAHEKSRVWVDNVFSFGRDGGAMRPSPHARQANQHIDVHLEGGLHSVTAVVGCPSGPKADWVVTVADPTDRQWIPDAFLKDSHG